jgi:methanogenic corrinoid protein MtbC1
MLLRCEHHNRKQLARLEDVMDDSLPDLITTQDELVRALLSVDRLAVKRMITQLYPGIHPYRLAEILVVPALEEIGKGWEAGLYSLSQVYMSGRICEETIDLVLPPEDSHRRNQPRMAIVVLEDHHLLGKRIVYSVLRASGFELADFGQQNVEQLTKRIQMEKIEILLISVLMLPSALKVKNLRAALDEAGVHVKIIVGGAPFRIDRELWRQVGADAYGGNVGDAVEVVNQMIKELE